MCWICAVVKIIFFRRSTLPETNSSPLKIGHLKRKLVFQPSIFRGYVSFREGQRLWLEEVVKNSRAMQELGEFPEEHRSTGPPVRAWLGGTEMAQAVEISMNRIWTDMIQVIQSDPKNHQSNHMKSCESARGLTPSICWRCNTNGSATSHGRVGWFFKIRKRCPCWVMVLWKVSWWQNEASQLRS